MELLLESILNKGVPFAVAYGGLLVGLLIFVFFVIKRYRSSYWPKVRGKVTESQVIVTEQTSYKTQAKQQIYELKLHYSYEVKGQRFLSSRIRYFQARGTSQKMAENDHNRFLPETEVDVFYHPENPSESVLLPGLSRGVLLLILFFGLSLGTMSMVAFA